MELLRYYLDDGTIKTISDTQIGQYINDSSKRPELSEFVYERHYHRYIKPFMYKSDKKIKVEETGKFHDEYSLIYKNGFSIMANCCLLIETLESFYRGWESTKDKSEKAFLKFFTRDNNFKEFSTEDLPTKFYKNIRCGILHQGETTDGWSITRKGGLLLDKTSKQIDATLFLTQLNLSLKNYKDELDKADWTDEIWKNAIKKIKAILKNSKKY